jgi:hypothetical protein
VAERPGTRSVAVAATVASSARDRAEGSRRQGYPSVLRRALRLLGRGLPLTPIRWAVRGARGGAGRRPRPRRPRRRPTEQRRVDETE